MSDFQLHPRQKEFFENPGRFRVLPIRAGQRGGRTAATIALVRFDALDDEQAELAINDLRTRGYCLMRNGRRYDPPKSSPAKITFDEMRPDKLP